MAYTISEIRLRHVEDVPSSLAKELGLEARPVRILEDNAGLHDDEGGIDVHRARIVEGEAVHADAARGQMPGHPLDAGQIRHLAALREDIEATAQEVSGVEARLVLGRNEARLFIFFSRVVLERQGKGSAERRVIKGHG